MNRTRGAIIVVLLLAVGTPIVHGQNAPPPAFSLTPAAMEEFLLKAKIVDKKTSKTGVTNTIRATLSDGRITHDAQIQTVDVQQMVFTAGRATEVNFKDTYRYNIGAYRLSRLLGMTNVPMSVKRRYDNKDGAMTWWIDDVQFDESGRLKHTPMLGPDPERTSKQNYVRLAFDELIQNRDRNQGNLLWTKDWTLWLIDHTRAFRLGKELIKPEQLVRCSRSFFEAMQALTLEQMDKSMGDIMTKEELKTVIARRDLLVKHFVDRAARVGDASVFFTM
jgi:hypothetical protein